MMHSSRCVRTIKCLLAGLILIPSVASADFYDQKTDVQKTKPHEEPIATEEAMYIEAHFEELRSARMKAIMSMATPAQREMLQRRESERKELIRSMPH